MLVSDGLLLGRTSSICSYTRDEDNSAPTLVPHTLSNTLDKQERGFQVGSNGKVKFLNGDVPDLRVALPSSSIASRTKLAEAQQEGQEIYLTRIEMGFP